MLDRINQRLTRVACIAKSFMLETLRQGSNETTENLIRFFGKKNKYCRSFKSKEYTHKKKKTWADFTVSDN